MSASIHKRQRRENSDDSDDEWTGESSGSSQKCIPHDTSEWTDNTLRKLNISWHQTVTNSPNDLLDFVNVPILSEELENTSTYIEKKLDFDMTFDDIDLDFKAVYDKFSDLQQLLKNSAGETPSSFEPVRTYGIEFLAALKKLVVSRAYALNSYKASFLTILESFCKMCQLFGSNVYMKRRCKIHGQDVNSKPDLVFEIDNSPFEAAHKLENFSGASTLCVAEVKKHNDYKVHKKRRETRSSETSSDNLEVNKDLQETEAITEEPLLPYEINGSAQHAGQLLLETKHSLFLFSKASIGIMFTETKVMMTCLKLSRNYLLHMEKGLNETDSGIIYYTKMYDILKAEDRKELITALLKLSCCADTVKLTKK
ncbi:uncharacterized protein LOC143054133 [Mytilus galloprovincialis]|uniref:uncharacterized protein LOC143054133 n=1 Tax=Mytilus galloprovincialis TaxID=29158 RepID=UPI003F7BE361